MDKENRAQKQAHIVPETVIYSINKCKYSIRFYKKKNNM